VAPELNRARRKWSSARSAKLALASFTVSPASRIPRKWNQRLKFPQAGKRTQSVGCSCDGS
jgi:hypothetical protein